MKELSNIAVILVRPKYAENIGSVARIALNMGVEQLWIVGVDSIDREAAGKTATHNAAHLLDKARFAANFSEVVPHFSMLIGTTARVGRGRRPTSWPDQLAAPLRPYLHSGKAGLVFGPENTGLGNDILKHCGMLTTIPTAQFSSLNLAQSVGILCYELRKGLLQGVADQNQAFYPKQPAKEQELAAMYLEATRLFESLDTAAGQAKTDFHLKYMHQLLGRAVVTSKEAKLIKDACRDLVEAVENTKTEASK
nr:hypothetical protein [Desulfobulbaceae bacterium]